MDSALIEFEEGIKSLTAYVKCTEAEDLLLEAIVSLKTAIPAESPIWPHHQLLLENRNNKKIYVYSAVIIRLYGLLERYVESLIENYLNFLSAIVPVYGNLPENIRKHHVPLSLELINGVSQDWYRGSNNQQSLVANLNSCLNGEENYVLNVEAFVIHRANFRIQQIIDQLGKIGIQNLLRRIVNSEAFKSYFLKENANANLENISDPDLKTLFSQIDELATIRNAIAHGHSPDELESAELLIKRLEFAHAFCVGLQEAATSSSLPMEILNASTALGKPIKIYDHSIVCFTLSNVRVRVGDHLIAETGDSTIPHKSGAIVSMQVDDQPLNEIVLTEAKDVALKVVFKAKENYFYHLISK